MTRDELLQYYELELNYLRRLGAEFGKRYPRVASALQLDPTTRSEDPHVERLLEGFAFLAARIHLRIDDNFPEISQALLDAVYPEYARPIPSMSIVQLELDPDQGKLTTGYPVPTGSMLYSRAVGGVQCRFRTCYDTTIWPIRVASAAWSTPAQLSPPVRGTNATAALTLRLESPADLPFEQLSISSLRLYLSAEPNVSAAVYELLCNNCEKIIIRKGGKQESAHRVLPGTALSPVGFELEEGVLPVPRRSHVGFRLLTEYFTFPEKFNFFDLNGLECIGGERFGSALEVVFLISRFERADRFALLEGAVGAETLRLGCTPIINLFPHTPDPISVTQKRPDYQIVPDARRREAIGVYSVEGVTAVLGSRSEPVRLEPLYSHRHTVHAETKKHFWHATRRARGGRPGRPSDVHLSFVDLDGAFSHPETDNVTAHLLCHNADLPTRLKMGDARGEFEMPNHVAIRRISALKSPTPLIPARAEGPLWRLVSLLSLNYVSLVDGGPATLQELLRLHNLRDTADGERQIQAISSLRARPTYARINGDYGLALVRGHRIELELDEEEFAGGGVYLFASVLERFFALYTSLNTFNVLQARTRQRKEVLKEWPPRSGVKALV